MASTNRPPEDFFFDTSEDEGVRDAADSTTVDDSYLASLSERMAKEQVAPKVPKKANPSRGAPPVLQPSKPPPVGRSESFVPDDKEDFSVSPGFDQTPAAQDPPQQDGQGRTPAPSEQNDVVQPPKVPIERRSEPPVPKQSSIPPQDDQYSGNPSQHPPGPSDLLHSVPPPPDESDPLDPEVDPATYDAPTFIRPTLVEQEPVPVVEIIQGNEAGRSYRFEKDILTIGRSLENDIVLTDIAVSRQHMRLMRESYDVLVEDMGSGNGTLVNGAKITKSPLSPVDRVEVGNTIYRIVFPGQESMPSNALHLGEGANPNPLDSMQQNAEGILSRDHDIQGLQQLGAAPHSDSQFPESAQAFLAPAVSPSAPAGFASLKTAEVTSGSKFEPPPSLSPTEPNGHQIVATRAPQRSSPKSLKLAMAILAVGMLVIGSVAIISAIIHVRNRGPNATNSNSIDNMSGDELFGYGSKAFAEQRWSQAVNAFERVLALSPSHSEANAFLQKARAERRNQGTLEAARQALSEENFEDAIITLTTIPRSSAYSGEALEMRASTEERHAKTLVGEARNLSTDDRESALERLERALKLSPTNSEAQTLRRKLLESGSESESEPSTSAPGSSEASPAAASSSPPIVASAPSRPSGSRNRARLKRRASNRRSRRNSGGGSSAFGPILSLYKTGDFSGAQSRADELAASASSDSERAKARSLSRKISRFAKAFRGSQSSGNARQKMSRLETAHRLDKQISGGHYSSQIRPSLRDVYVGNAKRAWRAGQYASACRSANLALKMDQKAAAAKQISGRCKSKASDFYQRGVSLRGSNLNQAKGYWRKVLKMVPRSNPTYTKAYSALNNAGRRRYQDEDE